LVIDVGGAHVKVLESGDREPRKFESGLKLTAKQMVAGMEKIVGDWKYDAVSIGFPGLSCEIVPWRSRSIWDNGWVGFDFRSACGCPVKLVDERL
jgi:polyphosphate glucokinase